MQYRRTQNVPDKTGRMAQGSPLNRAVAHTHTHTHTHTHAEHNVGGGGGAEYCKTLKIWSWRPVRGGVMAMHKQLVASD